MLPEPCIYYYVYYYPAVRFARAKIKKIEKLFKWCEFLLKAKDIHKHDSQCSLDLNNCPGKETGPRSAMIILRLEYDGSLT